MFNIYLQRDRRFTRDSPKRASLPRNLPAMALTARRITLIIPTIRIARSVSRGRPLRCRPADRGVCPNARLTPSRSSSCNSRVRGTGARKCAIISSSSRGKSSPDGTFGQRDKRPRPRLSSGARRLKYNLRLGHLTRAIRPDWWAIMRRYVTTNYYDAVRNCGPFIRSALALRAIYTSALPPPISIRAPFARFRKRLRIIIPNPRLQGETKRRVEQPPARAPVCVYVPAAKSPCSYDELLDEIAKFEVPRTECG